MPKPEEAERLSWSYAKRATRPPSDYSWKQGGLLAVGLLITILFGSFTPPVVAAAVVLVATLIAGGVQGAWAGGVFGFVAAFAVSVLATREPLADHRIVQVATVILATINFAIVGLLAGLVRELDRETTLIAELDRMTGLVNRTGFIRQMEAEANRSRRSSWPIAIGFLDLDRFKLLNDSRGPAAGDAALKVVGRTLAANVRNYDTAARLGGDEFAVLWPVQSAAGAETAATRLHETLINAAADQGFDIGVSLGLAVFEAIPDDAAELLARADELMYEAKQTGRGRVVMRTYRDASGARETDERR